MTHDPHCRYVVSPDGTYFGLLSIWVHRALRLDRRPVVESMVKERERLNGSPYGIRG